MNVNIVGENQGVNVQERTKEEEEINTNESELSGILIIKMNREMNQELFWESFDKSYRHEGLEKEEANDDPENCLVVERVKKVVATKKVVTRLEECWMEEKLERQTKLKKTLNQKIR